jgi:polysaccharide export outer membrane protein
MLLRPKLTRRGRQYRPRIASGFIVVVLTACEPVYPTGVNVEPALNRLTEPGLVSPVGGGVYVTRSDYRINPGDVVAIKFPRLPAYTDTFVVRPDGKISPPLIHSVVAAGLTSDELQDVLIASYRDLVRAVPPPSKRTYPMQVDDVLSVRFPYIPDMNSDVTVRGDGRISLPLIGDIVAERRTPATLQTELKKLYTGKIDNPEVTVMVKEPRSDIYELDGVVRLLPSPALRELSVNITKTAPLLYYVGGEVPSPGVQPFVGDLTALQAIYTAGGSATSGDMRSVVILRRGLDNSVVRIVTDLTADLGGTGTGDVALQPFDVIIVPRSNIAKVGDALDQYIYRLVRPLSNSSVGFFFTRQIGTVHQNTQTTVTGP